MNRLLKTFAVGSLVFITMSGCGQASPTPSKPAPSSQPSRPTETTSPPTVTMTPTEALELPETADVIYYNGTILTMETDQPTAQAIALRGRMIEAIGSNEEIQALRGPATQAIDLQGRTIMPGFVDAHSHLFNDAAMADLDIDQAQQQALEYGITTFADLFVTPEFLNEMRAYEQAGKLRMRTSLYMAYSDPCGDVLGDWYMEIPPTRDPGEMLRIGGVKVTADGGVCGKITLSTGYPGGGYGDLWFTQDELNQMVAMAQNAGYQVAIHAQGDLAIEQAQNAIAFALNGEPNLLRHRLEHNPLVRPDLLGRYSEIGIIPIAWGTYPTCAEVNNGLYSSYFGTEPMPWLEDWRALLDANPDLPVAWHSDFPYASLDPFLHLYSYVTRQEIDEDGTVCLPPDWLAAHRITVEEALPMMTINAAYALFRDEEVGSLKTGKYADLIVVSDDPTEIDPNDLVNIEVWMTMVGGRVEFCADGHENLCPQMDAAASSGLEDGTASQAGISASASLSADPPENAFDDDMETIWNSGGDAPQWIAIDLGEPKMITGIRLNVAQDPEGRTIHRVLGKVPNGDDQLLHEFDGETIEAQILSYFPPEPWTNIEFIKIETVQSPSWVAWREIIIETP